MSYFLIYATCLAISMYFIDLTSDNFWFSVAAPVSTGVSILLIIIWFIIKGASGSNQAHSSAAAPLSNDVDCSGGDC